MEDDDDDTDMAEEPDDDDDTEMAKEPNDVHQ